MPDDVPDLRSALVDAYPKYVVAILAERGVAVDDVIADAIVTGAGALDALLRTLVSTDAREQRQSPLELFREALRPVSHALEVQGVPQPAATAALAIAPWDRYSLSPGSSQVLGREAHEAHLRWGAARAAALAPLVLRPAIGLHGPADELSAMSDAIESAGFRPASSDEAPSIELVHLGWHAARSHIDRAVDDVQRVVVIGHGIDDLTSTGLRALGVASVVEAERFYERPADHLPAIA